MRSSADRASAHCKWHKCTLSASRMLTESFVTLQNASSNSSNHNRCHNLPGNRRKSWLRSTKNDNSSCERAHAIFRWASTIFCWASTCQFLITRLLIGQRASYNRFFHWLFPDANDGSNDRPSTIDHRPSTIDRFPIWSCLRQQWLVTWLVPTQHALSPRLLSNFARNA